MTAETKGLWKGRPLEELSKDELIDVIMWLAKDAERIRESHRASLNMLKNTVSENRKDLISSMFGSLF